MNKANDRRARSREYLFDLNPDIALLQEVNSIPDFIQTKFQFRYRKVANGDGTTQKFGTAVLVKGDINAEISFTSQSKWVSERLNSYMGIFIGVEAVLENGFRANVVSVHSPAWPLG
jgi:hypothetical protein